MAGHRRCVLVVAAAALVVAGCGVDDAPGSTAGDLPSTSAAPGGDEFVPTLVEESSETTSFEGGGGGELLIYSSPDALDDLVAHYRAAMPDATEEHEGDEWTFQERRGDDGVVHGETVTVRPPTPDELEQFADGTVTVVVMSTASFPEPAP